MRLCREHRGEVGECVGEAGGGGGGGGGGEYSSMLGGQEWRRDKLEDSEGRKDEVTLTELRMMAEGRFASLPRSLHAHHNLEGGPAHPGAPSGSSYSSRRLQASLASSMDLLSSRPGFPPGQSSGLSEPPAAAYQPVSIHGTMPRRKRGGNNLAHGNYTWDPRANHTQAFVCGNTPLSPGHVHQPLTSPLVQNILDDFHGYREPAAGPDATVDYVKVGTTTCDP
ncbi:unnamed protein product [Pleuronectes platessa]|uniref:Uncharacterized protein n=1 Tax=Pleuronectes platessa TaxID=8262 RepID=A0A9N7VDR7_PLEPL|nr:unnamed protein product [Pleuronectes platessa]